MVQQHRGPGNFLLIKVGSENTPREATVELLFALIFYNRLICSLDR